MAALNFTVSAGDYTFTGATTTTAMTVIAPTTQRVKIKGLSVFGKGTTNTDTPPKVTLTLFSSISGGANNSGLVVAKRDQDIALAVQTGCAGVYTTEPTYTSPVNIETWDVHPQTGIAVWFDDDPIILKAGTGLAVRIAPNQGETMSVNLQCEE